MAEEKKKSRTGRKSALSREINNVNRFIVEDKVEEVRNRIDTLKAKFASFEEVHNEYMELIKENAELCDSEETYFDEAQCKYVDALTKIKQWLASQTAQKDATPSSQSGSAEYSHSDLLGAINMPKVELEAFDGNPMNFHNFFAVFDEHVDRQRQEPSVKLTRLLQYTTGPAKEAIRNCALIGGAQGYKQARDILKRRFGDNHLIFDTVVKTVRFGKEAKSNTELLQLADEISNCKAVLSRMERLAEVDNQMFIVDVMKRLPFYIRNKWRDIALDFKEKHDKYPPLEDFEKFVLKRASGANDPVYGNVGSTPKPKPTVKSGGSSFSTQVRMPYSSSGVSSRVWPCKACGENHRLFSCQVFKDMRPYERLKFVKDHKLCENCLLGNHQVADCRKQSTCSVPGCGQKHTKYVHVDQRPRNHQTSSAAGISNSVNAMNANVHANSNSNTCVNVPVVTVKVNDRMDVLALLDCASTNSFCTRRLANSLGLKGSAVQYSLSTLNRSNESRQTEMVNLNLVSSDGAEAMKLSCVYVVDDIPVKVPNVDLSKFPHLCDVPLVRNGSNVEILIGQDHSEALIPLESRRGPAGDPFAVKTLLGWSLNGPTPCSGPVSKNVVSHFITTNSVEDSVQRLWSIENDGWLEEKSWSVEDRKVVQLWDEEGKFHDGHYVLPIPFRENSAFPSNLSVAVSRLKSLKVSLDRRELFDQYNLEIQKLIAGGHAEKVPLFDVLRSSNVWYLPHHAVISPNKPGKLRVVYDCASKYAGESLNDKCLQGPDFNNKLLHVLLRFRLFEFAVMADVEKMYYQVRVPETDRDYLRFLWFNDLGGVDHLRMTSHVFGGIWSGSAAT